MTIDWSTVATASVAFVADVILKTLLDFKLAAILVKYLHWVPVRNVFRSKPPELAGTWETKWETDSPRFGEPTDKHDTLELRQLGTYCYAEFIAQKVRYALFCQTKGQYVVGDWYDKKDSLGYHGAFELRIVDSNTLAGQYLGHSKSDGQVKAGLWSWQRVP